MSCSICGSPNHNSRTCPQRGANEPRDHALWLKVDNLTRREASDLQSKIIKDKNKIAPLARGTTASGLTKDLPQRIREVLHLGSGDNNGTKKK